MINVIDANGRLSQDRVLTLGADPEIFVFDNEHKLIPAFNFLPAKSEETLMYWDGFQAEWKYNHVVNYCQNNLVYFTRERLFDLRIKAISYNPNAKLSLRNVVRISPELLKTANSEHVALGCMPSYNAYKLRGKRVENPRKLALRCAGGHMHFGTWYNKRPQYEKIVTTLDNILGVWAVGVARHLDVPARRQYYGLAGEYRTPRYGTGQFGVEYRVLSNFWLASPALMQVAWDLGRTCVRLAHSRSLKLWASNQQETIETINNCDTDQAKRILQRNGPMLKWLFRQTYRSEKAIEKAVQIAYEGWFAPDNFLMEWHPEKQWIPDGCNKWARWELMYR